MFVVFMSVANQALIDALSQVSERLDKYCAEDKLTEGQFLELYNIIKYSIDRPPMPRGPQSPSGPSGPQGPSVTQESGWTYPPLFTASPAGDVIINFSSMTAPRPGESPVSWFSRCFPLDTVRFHPQRIRSIRFDGPMPHEVHPMEWDVESTQLEAEAVLSYIFDQLDYRRGNNFLIVLVGCLHFYLVNSEICALSQVEKAYFSDSLERVRNKITPNYANLLQSTIWALRDKI